MELDTFVADWTADPKRVKPLFVALRRQLHALSDATVEFHARPGVTYSMRGVNPAQDRPLFALVDVIDDPDGRWLSVCFYEGTVADPDERGEVIPEGLLGEDGYCFDVEDGEPEAYLIARIAEAYAAE